VGDKRRRKRNKPASPRRLQAQHDKKLMSAAAMAGMPDSQRQARELALVDVPQIGSEATPIKETVRRLTRIEKLARSGVLEPHMKLACEWYAECHGIGFDGSCRTSNFEGRSGGGDGSTSLLARSKREMMARDDYRWARSFIPAAYLEVFEAVIIRQDTIAAIAAETFSDPAPNEAEEQKRVLARSQAEAKTRKVLQLCANMLFDGIKRLLPIEDVAPSKPKKSPLVAPAPAEAPPRKPVTEEILAKLDEAMLGGIPIAAVFLGKITAEALSSEAPAALDRKALTFLDVPIVVQHGWRSGWGVILKVDEEGASRAA
jgi:hypothetical protein